MRQQQPGSRPAQDRDAQGRAAQGQAAHGRDAGRWDRPVGTPAGRNAATGNPAGGQSLAPGLALTGVGALLLLVAFGALGAVIDLLFGPVLGTATLVLLPLGTLVASWLVRRRNLTTVLIAPPLVYALLVVSTLLVSAPGLGVTGLGAGLVYGFPAMAIATALGVAIWALRQVTGR